MARLTDSQGELLGGLKLSWDFAAPPLDACKSVSGDPRSPSFGENEIVRWLECSYGSVGYLTFSPGGAGEQSREADSDLRPIDCHNQVDKPQKRHYCPSCGGYYCATHAAQAAHECRSIYRKR